MVAREIGDRRGEGYCINNLGVAFKNKEKYIEALACYLKEELGEKKFKKLRDEVKPEAEEIVRKMLDHKKSG